MLTNIQFSKKNIFIPSKTSFVNKEGDFIVSDPY